jgi:hypothetical protein
LNAAEGPAPKISPRAEGTLRAELDPSQAPATAEPDPRVEAGRDALGSSWRFPWYDDDTDGVRRIRVSSPWQAPDWNYNGSGFSFSWLEALAWAIGALLLAGLTYLLIKAYLNRENVQIGTVEKSDERVTVDDAARVEALPFRIRRGATDLLGEARRCYERGNFADAIIYLFSYQLVELDKHQLIRLTKGKTNRQYLREIGRRSTLKRLVEQTMVAFEDVFFGGHDLQRERFEACWSQLPTFDVLLAGQDSA